MSDNAEPLEDLLRGEVVLFQPRLDPGFVGIEFAAALGTAGGVVVVPQPVAHGFLVHVQLAGDLADGEFLLLAEGADAAIGGVVDHAVPPRIWRKMAATGWAWPERAASASRSPLASTGNSSESTW